ncbi:MAG: hypothetical protein RL021_537 [Bacteroidota bacterium]
MKLLIYMLIPAMLLAAIACKKESDTDPSSGNTLNVEYSISCTDCFVYCTGANGQVNNFFNQNSSWKYTYQASIGDTLRLVAQNTSGQPASVAGYIRLNNTIVAADTSYCPINGVIIVSDTL